MSQLEQTYEIIRFYREDPSKNEVTLTGLTLEEAHAHCNDPETSSTTAVSKHAQEWTQLYGDWFDGFSAHYPPCEGCGSEEMDEIMSPSIKTLCTDCTGETELEESA